MPNTELLRRVLTTLYEVQKDDHRERPETDAAIVAEALRVKRHGEVNNDQVVQALDEAARQGLVRRVGESEDLAGSPLYQITDAGIAALKG